MSQMRTENWHNEQHSVPLQDPPVEHICVVGAGHVGGPVAAVTALYHPNIRVDVVDKDEKRICQWKSNHLPMHEHGLNEIVQVARDGARCIAVHAGSLPDTGMRIPSTPRSMRTQNLFFSTDITARISEADVIFLAVNTSSKPYDTGAGKSLDTSAFDACVDKVIQVAKEGAIIVEKSTVPYGTAQRITNKLRAQRPGVSIEVLSNPEFLVEGHAIEDLIKPDRVIIGSSGTTSGKAAAILLSRIYCWVPPNRILFHTAWSSELSKLVANAMLAQRISSINAISAICEVTKADVEEVAESVGYDRRLGADYLKSGLGYGGSCLRKDVASLTYLAESLGLPEIAYYWSQVNAINEFQQKRFMRRVIQRLGGNLNGKKITILGFAFKKGVGDVRESVALDIIATLVEESPAEISIFDPFCAPSEILTELHRNPRITEFVGNKIETHSDPYAACMAADALIIVTDHDQFQQTTSQLPDTNLRDDNTSISPPVTSSDETAIKLLVPYLDQSVVWQAQEPSASSLTTNLINHQPLAEDNGVAAAVGPKIAEKCRQHSHWRSPHARLDWTAIIRNAKQPVRIFDGRQILKHSEIERISFDLGIEVELEAIGKPTNKMKHLSSNAKFRG